MKKIYMSPQMDVIELKSHQTLLAGSAGVAEGNTLGDEFTDTDVSFAPEGIDLSDFE